MRIAVVSDIHANRYALRSFLAFLDQNPDITLVLNAGDLVNIGPHPHEVAETVLNDSRFVSICGNNEEAIAGDLEAEAGKNKHRVWTVSRLGKELHTRLIALPHAIIREVEGFKILMVHSRPENSGELPLIYLGRNLSEFWDDYSAEMPDIVIFGHTHAPFYLHHLERHFVNPGALGLSKTSTSSFCVLDLAPGMFNVTFHSLAWDREAIAGEFIKRNVPDKEFILERYFGIHDVTGL
jgi:putative phosphoesterase